MHAIKKLKGRVLLVAFAHAEMSGAHARLKRQAIALQLFDVISLNTENDLDAAFREEFRDVLTESVRGFGYYVWKPQIILQVLKEAEYGDVIVYLDSGSHVNRRGKKRMEEYISICKKSASGFLAFQLTLSERLWTKKRLIEHFGLAKDDPLLYSGQVQAGLILIEKRERTVELLEEWLAVYRSDLALVDDSLDEEEISGFREHRHDQSVFSLLAKIRGFELLDAREQFPGTQDPSSRAGSWSTLKYFPIHHKRDKYVGAKRALTMTANLLFPQGSRTREMIVRYRSREG